MMAALWSSARLALTAFLSLLLQLPPLEASELMGKVVPPYPVGILEDYGACVGNETDVCQRSYAVLKTAAGKDFLIVSAAEIALGKHPLWRVIDTVAFPKTFAGEAVVDTCKMAGVPDRSILAVVHETDDAWMPAKRWAYRIDETTGKFVELDPKFVECAYVGEE